MQNPSRRTQGWHIFFAAALAIVIVAVYGSIAWEMWTSSTTYTAHLFLAGRFFRTGQPPAPHFLLHALISSLVSAHWATTFLSAGRAVTQGCYLLIAVEMYGLFWIVFHRTRIGQPWLLFLLALATLVAEPVTLRHAYALGFLWPEAYEVPTSTLLKPFALASFGFAAWYMSGRRKTNLVAVGLFALSTIAGSLSKPSFLICMLPASALLGAYRLAKRLPLSFRELLIGLYVPAAAILTWQFFVTYSAYAPGKLMYHDSIVWAPFRFMHSASPDGLLLKFVLSILFPLVVAIFYWRQAYRSTMLVLAWLCFLFGASYTYLLSEKIFWSSGNMVWSGYVTVFLLLFASVVFWVQQVAAPVPHERHYWIITIACGVCFAAHVLSGIHLDWQYLTHFDCATNFRLGEFVCSK